MSGQDRGSRARTANPRTELSRWLARPGLVDDLHRLAQAEPEIIAVLMAACARHPAPITAASPLPEATKFTIVFLEQVTEAIQQGIPDEEPDASGPTGVEPEAELTNRQATSATWEPHRIEPPAAQPDQEAPVRRFHGRVFDPDEVTLEHDVEVRPLADSYGDDRARRPSRVLHPDEIIHDTP